VILFFAVPLHSDIPFSAFIPYPLAFIGMGGGDGFAGRIV
jgi:hypothetical protein